MPITPQSRSYKPPAPAPMPTGGGANVGNNYVQSALGAREMPMGGTMARGAAPTPAPTPAPATSPSIPSYGYGMSMPLASRAGQATPGGQSTPGVGTTYAGGFPNVPGSTGTSPTGYPQFPRRDPRTGKKQKLSKQQKRQMQNLPPWMQDPAMFQSTIGSINDILSRRGQMSPERGIAEEADIETGRGQSADAIRARLAQAGISPDDPMYQSVLGTSDQAANRLQAESRRARDLAAENQWRQDLQLVNPYLQMLMGATGPRGSGQISAAPVGGGGGGNTDWGGILTQLGGSYLQGLGQSTL